MGLEYKLHDEYPLFDEVGISIEAEEELFDKDKLRIQVTQMLRKVLFKDTCSYSLH